MLRQQPRNNLKPLLRSLPLYVGLGFPERDESRGFAKDLPLQAPHPGLVFDKFIDTWKIGSDGRCVIQDPESKNAKPELKLGSKRAWLEETVKLVKKNRGSLNVKLAIAIERKKKLIHALDGKCVEVKTDWRFVSGLGNSHPLEAGFIWHRTLGVPYLPGSSVKGLMRAWAEDWGAAAEAEVKRLFGDTKDQGAGALIVFDALPADVPDLELDIINSHYGDYYAEKKDSRGNLIPPADYLSPVPVFFIAVAAKTPFEFALAPHCPHDPEAKDDLKTGLELLCEALEKLGSGGKTAVGYGRMVNARIQDPSATPEEGIRETVMRWSLDELAENIGKKWKKTLEDLGDALDVVKAAIECRPDIKLIREWQNSDKENQKKAYKRLFGGNTR